MQPASGSHEVLSGVALVYGSAGPDGSTPYIDTFVESTEVNFGELPADVIDAYIASGEPMDKAGARVTQASRTRTC